MSNQKAIELEKAAIKLKKKIEAFEARHRDDRGYWKTDHGKRQGRRMERMLMDLDRQIDEALNE